MTVLENENKYLNAIMQQLKAKVKMYNGAVQFGNENLQTYATAITTLLDLCEALDIPVELKRGCVQAMGVYDGLTHEPVYLYDTIKMYEWEERV